MYFNIRLILIGLAALVVGVYLQLFGFNLPVKNVASVDPSIEGFFWPKQKHLGEFGLVDQDHQQYDLSKFQSKWNFVFFGYTHCPDICPITMNTMKQVRNILAKNPDLEIDKISFDFISVDGERDSPEILKNYVGFFGENFAAATGTTEQVDSLTGQLGVPYSIDPHEPGSTDYLVGHSGAIFLISPEATLASIFQPPHTAREIADRFEKIQTFLNTNS